MPPKPKSTHNKKGDASLSKRAHTKSVSKSIGPEVTTPVLEIQGTSVVWDNEGWGDASLDLASCMNMMMSMMVDLSNKVNGLEQVPQAPAAPDHVSSAEPLHDPKNTTQQAASLQNPEI